MDPTTTALIISQSITFFLLIISELLPFANLPYNGILQTFIDLLQQTVVAHTVQLTTLKSEQIKDVEPPVLIDS
jgi:hypothetical protein